MKKLSAMTMVLCVSAALTGCDQGKPAQTPPAAQIAAQPALQAAQPAPQKAPGGVAVVQQDEIVKKMGWDSDMNNKLKAAKAELMTQLDSYKATLASALKAKREEIAAAAGLDKDEKEKFDKAIKVDDLAEIKKLTDSHKKELVAAYMVAEQNTRAKENELNRELQGRLAELQRGFRGNLEPAARRAAEAKGFSTVIMVPSDTVLYYDPDVDLTNAVIDQLKGMAGLGTTGLSKTP